MKYNRVLLKLSGEHFAGRAEGLVDFEAALKVALEILAIKKRGVELGLVLGAGNIYRGRFLKVGKLDIAYAHYMGMLGTVINALALQAVFASLKVKSVVMSEFLVKKEVEKISPGRARQQLKRGYLVIFAGGTGKPGVTTDTAAVLRAAQIKADVIFKATNVAGVYDKDPDKYRQAKLYKHLTFDQAIEGKLQVMDQKAFELARQAGIPILVFKWQKGVLGKILQGKNVGTLVTG